MIRRFLVLCFVTAGLTSPGGGAPAEAQTQPRRPATTAQPADEPTAPAATAPATTAPATGVPATGAPAATEPTTTRTVGEGQPDKDGKVPKAATVRETEPTTPPPSAPPEGKPVLSAPAPPPEVLPVLPKTRYFMLIFGAESVPKRGRFTHTWMTIVKATPREGMTGYTLEGEQAKYYDLLAHTISWMPASLRIRVLKLRPECGVNLDLETSIRYTLGMCERVALWGPYEVNPTIAEEVYKKTQAQIAKLKSGRVLYKSLDFEGAAAAWCKNCIHAVSDMDGIGRRLAYNEIQHNGWEGSRVIVRYMAAADRIDPSVRHEWVAEALGVTKYCISRQEIRVCKPLVVRSAAAGQTGGE